LNQFGAEQFDFVAPPSPRLFYVVCSTPRSGSGYLCNLLWRTGQCGAPMEYFNYDAIMLEQVIRWGVTSLDDYVSVLHRRRTGPNGVFGLKCHFGHFVFLSVLSRQFGRFQPLRFIYIDREDLEAQSISLLLARQTQQWNVFYRRRAQPSYSRVQIDQCRQLLANQKEQWQRLFVTNKVEPLRVNYETICRDPAAVLSELKAFLGVAGADSLPTTAPPPLTRQADPEKADWLERYRAGT
jgi:LPS sulfotransferase NodH